MPTILGTARVRSGNKVSEFGNTTKRQFKPNVILSEFYSELLGQSIQMRVTTRVQKTIHKQGGLDNYLLLSKEKDYLCKDALALKKQVEEKFLEKGVGSLAVKESTKRRYAGLEGAHCAEEQPGSIGRSATAAADNEDILDLVPSISVSVRQAATATA